MSSFYGHYENFSYHYEPFQIDNCIKLGEQYKDIPINNFVSHLLGLDLGFSISKTSLVLIEHLEEYDKIIVRFAEELEGHPSPSEIVKKVIKICRTHSTWVYIDGSARSLITELKIAFNENIYEKAADVTLNNNRIIPVNFVKEHKPLLQNLYSLVSNEYLCIPESMEKVIISLKSAVPNEYSLDKTQSSYNDTLDAMRGLANVKFILLDEADFFPVGQQKDARDISERYIAKSNPYIVLTSTPNKPESLFYTIEKEKEEECIYHRVKLDYSYGLGKIYTQQEIDKQKQSPSWKREYCLQYLGTIGNIFLPSQIDLCERLGKEYSTDKIPVSLYTLKSIGVDFGFSSSSTAIVTLEHIKTEDRDIIRVIDCHLIDKGDPNSIVNLCWNIWQRSNFMNCAYWIDGSNRAMVNLLKIRWQESLSWESNESFDDTTRIRPVNFNTEHKSMLSNLHAVISKGYLAIDPKYDKLLISLRTAYANELTLDKQQTSYSDLLDGLRLGLKAYQISDSY